VGREKGGPQTLDNVEKWSPQKGKDKKKGGDQKGKSPQEGMIKTVEENPVPIPL